MNLLFVSATRQDVPEKTVLFRSIERLRKLKTCDYRFICGNTTGLSEVYNSELDRICNDRPEDWPVVVFAHDDLEIQDLMFFEHLEQALKQAWVVGVAGAGRFDVFAPPSIWRQPQHQDTHSGCVWHPPMTPSLYGPERKVTVMDGCLIAMDLRQEALRGVRFDTRFKFHFYDLDLCVTLARRHVPMAVMLTHVLHHSPGKFDSMEWRQSQDRYREKWTAIYTGKTLKSVDYRHSGNFGDLLYSLPYIRQTGGGSLWITTNRPGDYSGAGGPHPGGKLMITPQMAEWLLPLLKSQTWLKDIVTGDDGYSPRYDLDLFRQQPLNFHQDPISTWYRGLFSTWFPGKEIDLTIPTLDVKPDPRTAGRLVVSRTERYRNPLFSYSFCKEYRPIFIGLPKEYTDFQVQCPTAEYIRPADALEFAGIIAGARAFIGNQSFAAAAAELLKVQRYIELPLQCPNNIPQGPRGFATMDFKAFKEAVSNA